MIEDVEGETTIEVHVRCIKQYAATVVRNVKFHLSLQKEGLYTAKNVIGSIGPHVDTKNLYYIEC
jgi:hypothetical protein